MIRTVVRAWFACLAVGLISTASVRAADEAHTI